MIKSNRIRKKIKIRKKISGTAEVPRLCIYRSLKSIYVQAIDDVSAHTICASLVKGKKNKEAAKELAVKLTEQLKEKKITKAKFDRNGYKFAGFLKVFTDQLRDNSISI